jgi:GH18 family chitinase
MSRTKGEPKKKAACATAKLSATIFPLPPRHWDDHVKVPWLCKKERKIMISYEDSESLVAKRSMQFKNTLEE